MSQAVLDRLKSAFGERVLETRSFRGDDEATVAPADWCAAATFVRDDPECAMNHFIDLTAADYPERVPETPRFDVLVMLRSLAKGHRVRLRTRVRDGQALASLVSVWSGADWTEREVWDMFGIPFEGHPDLRRILMYDEFVGYPLRKDYPIDRVQPLVAYRDVPSAKLAPFGRDMGIPFGRIDWRDRLRGGDQQVSPAIAVQLGQQRTLSGTSESGQGSKGLKD